MQTQVTFTTQEDLKKRALAKARHEGLSLKTVLVYALKGFVAGTFSFGLTPSEPEPDVEPLEITDPTLLAKAAKLAALLK